MIFWEFRLSMLLEQCVPWQALHARLPTLRTGPPITTVTKCHKEYTSKSTLWTLGYEQRLNKQEGWGSNSWCNVLACPAIGLAEFTWIWFLHEFFVSSAQYTHFFWSIVFKLSFFSWWVCSPLPLAVLSPSLQSSSSLSTKNIQKHSCQGCYWSNGQRPWPKKSNTSTDQNLKGLNPAEWIALLFQQGPHLRSQQQGQFSKYFPSATPKKSIGISGIKHKNPKKGHLDRGFSSETQALSGSICLGHASCLVSQNVRPVKPSASKALVDQCLVSTKPGQISKGFLCKKLPISSNRKTTSMLWPPASRPPWQPVHELG